MSDDKDIKPTGIVTFLFCELEGSTKNAQEFPDEYYEELKKLNTVIQNSVGSNRGFIFKKTGDTFCCSFDNAANCLKAAYDIQIENSKKLNTDISLKIRIGIHTGPAEWNGEDYSGYITLAQTSRILSVTYEEQILISNDTYKILNNSDISKIKIDNDTGSEFLNSGNENIDRFLLRDLGERRLKDLNHPIKIFQLEAHGLREDFPPLETLDARPNNLPLQISSFIGREKEIKKIKELLKNSRLITILGTGGVGKTRLAIHSSAEIVDDFTNGVWIAEFASISDGSFLIPTILKIFNINVNPEKTPEETLFDYLREKKLLIILDNCEHILRYSTLLAEKLLKNCPGLKIIVTSREALNCTGEHILRISSMTLPDADTDNSPEKLTEFESVRLFLDRALMVNQNFHISKENASALAAICNSLDGIPLAIELAAARTKILSVEKIFERLNDRFSLLTGGKRTSLPRQQTLKALIDWSFDLLSENEKILFNRLSVFSGGWSLEAAEQICSDELIDEYEVLDLISNLIDKSLIITKELKGVKRFFMLETIRQYSIEKLDPNDLIFIRHAEYFLKLSSDVSSNSDFKTRQKWRNEMEKEQDNIRLSINRSEKISPEVYSGLIINFAEYLEIDGYYKEAYELLNKVITLKEEININDRATSFINGAYLASFLDENETADKYINQGLEIIKSTGNKKGLAEGLSVYGIICYLKGDMQNAIKYTEESLVLLEGLNEKTLKANTLGSLAAFKAGADTFEESLKLLDEAISIYSDQSQTDQFAKLLISKGAAYYQSGDYENAKKYFAEGLPILLEVNDLYSVTSTLYNLGNLNVAINNYSEAEKYFEEAMSNSKENGYTGIFDRSHIKLGEIALIKNENLKAKEIFTECLKYFNKNSEKLKLILSIYGLGNYFFLEKNYELSAKYFILAEKINDEWKFNLSKWRESENDKIILKLKNELSKENYDALRKEFIDLNTENAAVIALEMCSDL